jgi:hypothetical protein
MAQRDPPAAARFKPPPRGHVSATMAQRDPDTNLQRTTDELEERLGRLSDHIDEAEQKAEARRRDDAGADEEVHDETGGEDPAGAGEGKDDPER